MCFSWSRIQENFKIPRALEYHRRSYWRKSVVKFRGSPKFMRIDVESMRNGCPLDLRPPDCEKLESLGAAVNHGCDWRAGLDSAPGGMRSLANPLWPSKVLCEICLSWLPCARRNSGINRSPSIMRCPFWLPICALSHRRVDKKKQSQSGFTQGKSFRSLTGNPMSNIFEKNDNCAWVPRNVVCTSMLLGRSAQSLGLWNFGAVGLWDFCDSKTLKQIFGSLYIIIIILGVWTLRLWDFWIFGLTRNTNTRFGER